MKNVLDENLSEDMQKALRQGTIVPRVSIVFLCHDGEGRFLLHKRSQNCRDERGVWDCGGGGLDFGKTVQETLRDEVREEWGTDVFETELLGYRDVFRENTGEPTHWLALDWKVRVDPAQVRNAEPEKFEEIGWVRVDNLPTPLHSQLMLLFRNNKEKLKEFGELPE